MQHKRTRREFSPEDRAAYRETKREEGRQAIEAACRELLTSEGWRRWAETRARCHRYSFANCALIAMQRPDATRVAGFRQWEQLGRHVRKGERAIRIMAPVTVKERDRETGDATGEILVFFCAVPVFDIGQTEGEPLPEAPREPIAGNTHASYIGRLKAFASSIGYTVDREPLETVGGYCDAKSKRIVIAERHDSANAIVRVLVHELAHALGVGYAEYGREAAEVIVETATVIVCGAIGLDTSGESIPYIAGWGETDDLAAIRTFAEKVDEIARTLETACGIGA